MDDAIEISYRIVSYRIAEKDIDFLDISRYTVIKWHSTVIIVTTGNDLWVVFSFYTVSSAALR